MSVISLKRASKQNVQVCSQFFGGGETVLTMGKNMGKEPDADDLRAMEELLEELREKIACINAQIKEV